MSTIPTVPATLALSPIMAGLVKATSLTFDVDARTDLASGQEHGRFRRLSRDNALEAVIRALLATDAGRALVIKASKGDGKACALLAYAIPSVWKDGARVVSFYAENPTGEQHGVTASRPNPVRLALRALNLEIIAKEKADKATAKNAAKAERAAKRHEALAPMADTLATVAVKPAPKRKPTASTKGKSKATLAL